MMLHVMGGGVVFWGCQSVTNMDTPARHRVLLFYTMDSDITFKTGCDFYCFITSKCAL